MVHDKKRSGDPDYDDKVPAGGTPQITTADGQVVYLTESNGPVDARGVHVNLEPPNSGAELTDNRPAPGGVASEPSGVQVAAAPAKAAPAKATAPKAGGK